MRGSCAPVAKPWQRSRLSSQTGRCAARRPRRQLRHLPVATTVERPSSTGREAVTLRRDEAPPPPRRRAGERAKAAIALREHLPFACLLVSGVLGKCFCLFSRSPR